MHSADIDEHHRDQTNHLELNHFLGRIVERPSWKLPSLSDSDNGSDKQSVKKEEQVLDENQLKTPTIDPCRG